MNNVISFNIYERKILMGTAGTKFIQCLYINGLTSSDKYFGPGTQRGLVPDYKTWRSKMTTITEQGYQQFKMLSNNMMFRKHVKDSQNEITKILMSLLMCGPTKCIKPC